MIDIDGELMDLIVGQIRPLMFINKDDHILLQFPINFKAPEEGYSTIQLLNSTQIGTSERGEIDDQYGQRTKRNLDITFRVQAYGKRAVYRLNQLRNKLEWDSTAQNFKSVGINLRDADEVQNLTALLETRWEERASLDFILCVAEGSLSAEYDGSKVGLPDQPVFDEGIVRVQGVNVEIQADSYSTTITHRT